MRRYLLGIVFFFLPTMAMAGSITAEIDRTEGSVGEQGQLTITVSGSLKDDFEIPAIEGLDIRQSGTSTSVQIVNGSVSKETAYTYILTPQREGTFVIPSIKVVIDKEEAATAPLTLKVGVGSAGNQGQALVPGQSPAKTTNDPSLPIVIERELKKTTIYEGEAVLSTIRIFQNTRILQMVPERDPAPDWRVIGQEKQKTYNATRDGSNWRVTELQEVLIPLKSGDLEVPKFTLRATYLQVSKQRRRMGGIWDLLQNGMFDQGEQVTKKITTAAQKISVKQLPTEGRPKVVSDIVGDFELDLDVSKRELATGETATVTLKLSGTGPLDRMAEIKLTPLIGAKIYDDKPELKEVVDESGLRSTRTFKFAIVPNKSGNLDLGSVELGIFDPDKKAWRTLTAALGTVTVGGGAAVVSNSQSQPTEAPPVSSAPLDSTNHNQTPSLQMPGLKDETSLGDTSIRKDTWFVIAGTALLLSVLGIATGWVWRRYRGLTVRTSKTPFKKLAKVASQLSADQLHSVHVAFSALKETVASEVKSSGTLPPALTALNIAQILRDRGVASDTVTAIEEAAGSIEARTYRDQSLTREDVESFRDALTKLSRAEVTGS